jgi:hypothetical protein
LEKVASLLTRLQSSLKLRLDKTDWQASDQIAGDTPAATVNVPSRNVAVTMHRKLLMMRSIGSLIFKFAQANSQIFGASLLQRLLLTAQRRSKK